MKIGLEICEVLKSASFFMIVTFCFTVPTQHTDDVQLKYAYV